MLVSFTVELLLLCIHTTEQLAKAADMVVGRTDIHTEIWRKTLRYTKATRKESWVQINGEKEICHISPLSSCKNAGYKIDKLTGAALYVHIGFSSVMVQLSQIEFPHKGYIKLFDWIPANVAHAMVYLVRFIQL